jgi:hypothetical protein
LDRQPSEGGWAATKIDAKAAVAALWEIEEAFRAPIALFYLALILAMQRGGSEIEKRSIGVEHAGTNPVNFCRHNSSFRSAG